MKPSFTVQKNRNPRFLVFSFGLCSMLFLSSCLKDPVVGPPSSIPESVISGLMVIHGSPDAPASDFVLNREPVFPSNRSFGNYIPYFPLYAGKYEARFYLHGTYTNAFYSDNIILEKGKYHSFFLTGLMNDSLSTLLLKDDLTKPKEGNAKVRFINISPDAGALDFSLVPDSLFAEKISFKDYTPFHEVEAGKYSATFTTSEGSSIHYNFNLKLDKGNIYTVWAKGLVETRREDQSFGNGIVIHDLRW